MAFKSSFGLLAGGLLMLTGCVVRERVAYREPGYSETAGGVVVQSEPPPPIEETVTVAPAPGMIWIGGAWAWGGGRWSWERGHWDRPPRPGARWEPHRYDSRRNVWIRGGWR